MGEFEVWGRENMSLTQVQSKDQVEEQLRASERAVLGFFGSFSESSKQALPEFETFAARHQETPSLVVDVSKVKGVHQAWEVVSVPTVIVVERGRMVRRVSGAQTASYYERTLLPQEGVGKHETSPSREKRVVVYVSNSCPWCTKVKAYLRGRQVRFREVNVSNDPSAAAELTRRSGQTGVPQVDIEGEIVVGFDRQRIDALLGLKASPEP